MSLANMLEAGAKEFAAVARKSARKTGARKAAPGRWTVAECVEHVALVEQRGLERLGNCMAAEIGRRPDMERRLIAMLGNRETVVEAPEAVRPRGRFRDVKAALAAFQSARERTVRWARDHEKSAYSMATEHPRFGVLNAAEYLHFLDAHARRHAAQILETVAEAESLPAKARRPPEIADDLAEGDEDVEEEDGVLTLEGRELCDLRRPGWRVDVLRVDGCRLERVQLADGKFTAVTLRDVRLTACDLANVRASHWNMARVELVDCRLTGFGAFHLDWQDVLVRNCELSYGMLRGGTFRNCEFEESMMREADLQEADLRGSSLRGCELAGADLQRARLRGTDLRGSKLDKMLVGMGDLEGAIVEPPQAMVLAKVMGLKIV